MHAQQQQQQQQQQSQQRKSILKNNNITLITGINCEMQLSTLVGGGIAGGEGGNTNGVGSNSSYTAQSPIIKVRECQPNSAAATAVGGLSLHGRHSSKFSQKSAVVAAEDPPKRNGFDSPSNAKGNSQLFQGRKIDIFDISKSERHPLIRSILDNRWFQLTILLFTVFALFGDDIRVITTTKDADNAFDVINMACIVIFLLQIVFQYITEIEYRNSFFFWLDLLSTITIILDIQTITNAFFFKSNVRSTLQITRATRASRIGTKAGRVVRLVRLIRIARIYKQAQEKKQLQSQRNKGLQNRKNKIAGKYKNLINNRFDSPVMHPSAPAHNKHLHPSANYSSSVYSPSPLLPHHRLAGNSHEQQQQLHDSTISNNDPSNQIKMGGPLKSNSMYESNQENSKEMKESRVSKRLSDLTTKRVVIVVLLLLFIMPLFSKSFYFDMPASIDYHTNVLSQLSYMPECTIPMLGEATRKTVATLSSMKLPLLLFSQPFSFDGVDFTLDSFNALRDNELLETYIDFDVNRFLDAHSNLNDNSSTKPSDVIKSDPTLHFFWAVMSIRDQMVLQAILSLSRTFFVCIVLTMAAFFFSKDANDIALGPIERMITKVNQIANDPLSAKDQELVDEEQDQYETRIIENAIIKIGALLALGFGEAGSEIIGSNIAKHGDVDPMIPGKKKCAIYGFCDIRNFTDATEVLQVDNLN